MREMEDSLSHSQLGRPKHVFSKRGDDSLLSQAKKFHQGWRENCSILHLHALFNGISCEVDSVQKIFHRQNSFLLYWAILY